MKLFSTNSFTVLALIMLMTSACSLPTYFASSVHAPQLTEKGQFTASAGFGGNIEIKAAYAATNHLGLIADYTSTSSQEGTDPLAGVFNSSETEEHTQKMFHAGAGYFNTYKKFTYEAFAGFATGNADHTYRIFDATTNNGYDLNWKMKRVFLCTDAGIKFENFAAGLALRINYSIFDPSYVGFENSGNTYSSNNKSYNKNLDILNAEPGIYLRGGFKNVQLNLELAFSTEKENKWFLNSGGTFQVGLLFNLYRSESNKKVE